MREPGSPDQGRHRDLPEWARLGSVVVRAGHIAGFAVIAGAAVAGAAPPAIHAWWALVAGTGVLLAASEWASHPDLWRQLSGWATLLKVALIAVAAALPGAAVPLVLAAIVVSALGSHLPKRWRQRLIIGRSAGRA